MTISTAQFVQPNVAAIEKEIERAIDKGSKICCIVLPNHLKNSYKNIKMSSLQQEIVTQCVTEATLRKKGLQSIATKILLQIIAKRGNILWVPQMSNELEMSVMLVGFEQAKVKNKTLMACCATINSTFTLVHTSTKIYEGNENKYKTMSDLLIAAVAAYAERNKATPDEIICFNSSCTGDQISLYQDLFVKQSLDHLKGVYTDATISFSLVMINVKTNERFFGEKDGRPSNPPAGTLICTDVVSKDYDFYLISQGSNKGTAVPNHYKVVYSDSKIQEGLLQEIAFSQCFNYVNWTGSIKVPSIMQYAKKASTFGAEVLSDTEVPSSLYSPF